MLICKEAGCDKEVRAKGLCVNHYAVARRAGVLDIYQKKAVCDCGKPAQKAARFCKSCSSNNAEKKNKQNNVTCAAPDCLSHRIFGKGMCQKHYQQVKRKGKVLKYGRYDMNQIVQNEDFSTIFCRNTAGQITALCIVDNLSVEQLSKYKWCLDSSNGYVITREAGKKLYLHSLLTKKFNWKMTDHKNRDKLDNRLKNLRETDISRNACNAPIGINQKFSVPDVKGVHFVKSTGKYVAAIIKDGVKYAKSFDTVEEATLYRKVLAQIYHGEYAYEANTGP